jgi:hypothetical protein
MITFYPPKKGFWLLLLLFAAEEPTGRFIETLASEFGKGVRAVNDDLTIVRSLSASAH